MRIITLMENTQGEEGCAFEHGLSLYIETEKHKILADTGATGAFAENAEKLGVNLSSVDMVVLSHGHYDHSGGILTFTEKNRHARIYMQQKATGDFYHGERYIGIDRRIPDLPQVEMIRGDRVLDGEVSLFSNITGRRHFKYTGQIPGNLWRNACEGDQRLSHDEKNTIYRGRKKPDPGNGKRAGRV